MIVNMERIPRCLQFDRYGRGALDWYVFCIVRDSGRGTLGDFVRFDFVEIGC